MINSFIKSYKELLAYGEHDSKEPLWKAIPEIINWDFGNYCIIRNQNFKTNKIEDNYRIWNKDKSLYYFIFNGKKIWDASLSQAVENGWKFFDALSLIHRKGGIYYIVEE